MASAAGQRTAGKEAVERNQELAKEDLVGGTDTSGKEYAVSDAEKKLGGEDVAEDKAFASDKGARAAEKDSAGGVDADADKAAAAEGVAQD